MVNQNLGRDKNIVRISNLSEFIDQFEGGKEYYYPPFHILSVLEKEVLFSQNPSGTITINYSPEGFVMFDLREKEERDNVWIFTFEFTGTAS
ncbi:hypothetical protein [Siphonobacter curvatus]|uniref:Uncharacterized protein n=1 Tax=Siphonobacter curvatus TaxID=2094562 RepID=A0A2S7IMM4_9BACT|nr:hypothetical protein [Siphonobacter curvatus]PQA58991.1 hypothetical protein C5O19_04855 [Siphonobacter curvatus]